MLSQEMVSHIRELERKVENLSYYSVGFAKRLKTNEIEFHPIEAIDFDSDNELFLIPEGTAQYFNLIASSFTVEKFLSFFEINPQLLQYEAFAKAVIKITSEGGSISQNYPLLGTGWLPSSQILYFYYET